MSRGRINRLILLVQCIIRALFCGAANRIPAGVSRVIVVPTGKLGDVVCCTPVLRAIRIHCPQAYIIVAGNSKLHQPLLADSGLVDEYLDLEGRGVAARIKQYRAQTALVTGPSYESVAHLYLARIPLVVAPVVQGGFSPFETRPYKILQRFVKTFPYQIGEYAPRERLKVLEPLGIFSNDTKKRLGFSEAAGRKVKQFFSEHGIDPDKDFMVGISPAAGNKIKEWPEERFARVADCLVAKYQAKVLIIGGPHDKKKVGKTIGHLKPETKIVVATDFNIDELKALIAKLKLFIAVDTGPIYIAEAFNVPTIDIVGPMDERVQPPQGFIHRNVVPPNRTKPELSILNARAYDKEEASRQVESISVKRVTSIVTELVSSVYGEKIST